MSVVKLLMDTAVEDSRLLVKNQELGDRPEVPRDVEFIFYAKDEEKAKLVASFITDYRYGRPSVRNIERRGEFAWEVMVTINTPTTENVVMTLSAFMVCLAQLFDLDYDGWGSTINR